MKKNHLILIALAVLAWAVYTKKVKLPLVSS